MTLCFQTELLQPLSVETTMHFLPKLNVSLIVGLLSLSLRSGAATEKSPSLAFPSAEGFGVKGRSPSAQRLTEELPPQRRMRRASVITSHHGLRIDASVISSAVRG